MQIVSRKPHNYRLLALYEMNKPKQAFHNHSFLQWFYVRFLLALYETLETPKSTVAIRFSSNMRAMSYLSYMDIKQSGKGVYGNYTNGGIKVVKQQQNAVQSVLWALERVRVLCTFTFRPEKGLLKTVYNQIGCKITEKSLLHNGLQEAP